MSTAATSARAALPAPPNHAMPGCHGGGGFPPPFDPPFDPPFPPKDPIRLDPIRYRAFPQRMWDMSGRTTKDIASGIVRMYDQNRDGVVEASEAVRVLRSPQQYGAIQGAMSHWFGGQQVDVYSMTKLLFGADTNHNGKTGTHELQKLLGRFDTGDTWMWGRRHRPGASDGRLSGSEFSAFMAKYGEQHVGSWREDGWPRPLMAGGPYAQQVGGAGDAGGPPPQMSAAPAGRGASNQHDVPQGEGDAPADTEAAD